MHIAEGILSAPALVTGAALAAGGVALGLRKTDDERIPRVAVLASAFFVASLIHVNIGPGSVHLVLNGLMGVILGWASFPAILVALILQAVLFGYGGLTSLGANTVVMALPGVACYYLFRGVIRNGRGAGVFAAGFAAGAMAIVLGGLLFATALVASGKEFLGIVQAVLVAHVPVMVIEGFVTGSVAVFLRRVRPEMLDARERGPTTRREPLREGKTNA